MSSTTDVDICGRIAHVRSEVSGPRGRASFAQLICVAPSTYQNYETSRVPPATVLLKIADAAGVDIRWLLTGQARETPKISASDPVLQRAASLLDNRPDAAKPLAAFLDILAASLEFPKKDAAAAEPAPAPPGPLPAERPDPRDSWIPVLGRSAAGVSHFWASQAEANGVRTLAELIDRHARRGGESARPATARLDEEGGETPVRIIGLSAPVAGEVAEFVDAPAVKRRHGDAFALRIDGDSMAPEIRHGDLVILSPSAPAVDGKCAVVQLDGQIGVTCKLFRRQGDQAHLIPIHEAFDPQSFPASKVLWALRVLARVRTEPG